MVIDSLISFIQPNCISALFMNGKSFNCACQEVYGTIKLGTLLFKVLQIIMRNRNNNKKIKHYLYYYLQTKLEIKLNTQKTVVLNQSQVRNDIFSDAFCLLPAYMLEL